MKRKIASVAIVLALFVLLFSFSFGSAAISGGIPFFNLTQTGFGPGQVIEGKLNFSLNNESGNTLVRATINPGAVTKNATLLDFLKASGAQFICYPSDCNTTYSVVSGSAVPVKTLNLIGQGSEAYAALVASGANVQVLNLSFSMNGSVGQGTVPTCYETPFKFDLLGDGTIDFEYKVPSDSLCGFGRKASECYDASQGVQDAYLQTLPFCEKIWLNKTGKVQVEGFMKYWGYGYGGGGEPGDDDIQFFIHDLSGALKGSCNITGYELPQDLSYGYAGCNISSEDIPNFYIAKPDYYYVCVKKTSTAAYSIKAESQGNVCGFSGVPPQAPTTDFALYVREAAYAPFTEETFFNETTMIGTTPLVMSLQNYLASKYNNNCTGAAGCVIPLKFISISAASQQVTLKDLYFSFKVAEVPYTNNNFYDLDVLWPKLNMTRQEVQLRGLNVTAPQQQGNYYITVTLGPLYGSSTFKVEPVPQVTSVVPLIVIPGQPAVFRAIASAPAGRSIVSYTWNFGDGSGEITTATPNVSHTYSHGTFTLTVKVQDNLGMAGSGSFTVVSNITKELLNSTIESLLARINSVALQYETVELWYRDMLDLNLTMINSTLATFKTQLPTATQSQIASMFDTIQDYSVPSNIIDSLKLTDSPYFPDLERINPEYVSEITQETYNSALESQYQNAIGLWHQENIDLMLSGQIKTLVYETAREDKLTIVNIKIMPQTTLSTAHLIFSLPSGISYNDVKIKQGSFETSDLVNAVGFSFSDLRSGETVSIALPGKHDFSALIFYVSPNLKELDVGVGPPPGKEKGAPWGLAIFFIILIVIIVLAVLWFLWRGYTEKLEKKLFRNPMDLYNLMNFIATAEAKGERKEAIEAKLMKSGWNKEQVSYAWSKLKKQQKENERKAKKKDKREKEIRPTGAGTREMPFRSIYK